MLDSVKTGQCLASYLSMIFVYRFSLAYTINSILHKKIRTRGSL